jgi:hypothetical protein
MLWTNDTCGCSLEIEKVSGVWIATSIYSACPAHQSFNINDIIAPIIQENQTRNFGFDSIWKADVNDILSEVDASGVRNFKGGAVSWQYTGVAPDRILQITVSGINITNPQRNNFITIVNNSYSGAFSGRIQLV